MKSSARINLVKQDLSKEIKQIIVIRTDLKMGKGKLVAQGAHASVQSTLNAIKNHKNYFDRWQRTGCKKVVCKANTKDKLEEVYEFSELKQIPCSIIIDAGRTQIPSGTITAVAVGPGPSSVINEFTSDLKLL